MATLTAPTEGLAAVPAAVGAAVPASPAADRGEQRILDAALSCLARWGVAKTTLDDVAREARCSRATVYRAFPGGKEALLDAVARREVARFFAALAGAMAGAATLEDLLVAAVVEAGVRLRDHAALQYLVAHEPEVIVPRLAFDAATVVLEAASRFAGPYLEPWLGPDEALPAAEWVTRLVMSYAACPAEGIDMADGNSVRQLVRTYVLPGLGARSTTI